MRLLLVIFLAIIVGGPNTAIDVNHLPGFVNPYDPALALIDPVNGSINCQEPCGYTANGTPVEGNYGKIAACAPEQMGCWVTFSNDFGSHGPYQCNDTGGALQEPYMRDGRLTQNYDVLWPLTDGNGNKLPLTDYPWWNHAFFDVEVTCIGG